MTRRRLASVAFLMALALGACGHPSPEPAPTLPPQVVEAPVAFPSVEAALLDDGTYGVLSIEPTLSIWRTRLASGEPKLVLDPTNPFGEPVPLLVTAARSDAGGEDWLKILLPVRPNGATGWVRARDVRLVAHNERIVVDLSERTLKHFRDGKLVHRFSVGIGRPEYPTATGTFYVTIGVPQATASGAYGVFALGISGYSEVLRDWPGGGQMAIHGTSDPGDRGQMVSHGCVRVYNTDMTKLTDVPLGTPVIIRR